MRLDEVMSNPYPFELVDKDQGQYVYTFKLHDGTRVMLNFDTYSQMHSERAVWVMAFTRNGKFHVTGGGDAPRLFATVVDIIKDFIYRATPLLLLFSAHEESRMKLYSRMMGRVKLQYYREYRSGDIEKIQDKKHREAAQNALRAEGHKAMGIIHTEVDSGGA